MIVEIYCFTREYWDSPMWGVMILQETVCGEKVVKSKVMSSVS